MNQGNINIEFSFVTKPNETLSFKVDDNAQPPFIIAGELHGNLNYNSNLRQFEYLPEKDFTGTIDITLTYTQNAINSSVRLIIHVANIFKPRARIIKIIGQELISNDVIALVELIKNSYDADAENIEIHLNNIFSNKGEIIVKDDGSGMTFDKIMNVWLEPATPDKKNNGEHTYSICFKRRFLGEKGIGRFAVHRLGEKIELVTRARKNCEGELYDYETKLIIDWSDYTEDKYLSDIPVTVNKILNPQIFKNKSGTSIKILSINPWKNVKAVRDAVIKIKGLESPVKPKNVKLHQDNETSDPGVNTIFKSNDDKISKEIKGIKALRELLDTAFYKFSGLIDEKGNLIYDYSFNRIDYQDIKRSVSLKEENLAVINPDWFEEHQLKNENTPGKFEVNFYAWDLDTATLKVAGLADYYRNVIKPNAGVRIYRDNFRVWPYGEPDDDWLGLDLRRLNEPRERSVSRNQVFGIVHISSIENNALKDQSNREGLISNEQFEQFYQLVSAALTVFAKERKADKIKIDKVTKSKSASDIVTESIDKLRKNIEQRNHQSYYESDLHQIETAYKEKINDVLERYMMAAAIGISYSIPIHEMKLRLNSIKHIIDDLQDNPKLQDKFLKQLGEYVKETEDIVRAVSSIMSRQKRKNISLFSVAKNVEILKESELTKYNIDYEINGDKNIEVEAVPGLLSTAVLNLVDNAIYWLRSKKIRAREKQEAFSPKISMNITENEQRRIVLKVKDNGDGFDDPFELLIEPYYSRKADGLGLGLFLVSEIMIRIGGRLNGYNENGAVFELIF